MKDLTIILLFISLNCFSQKTNLIRLGLFSSSIILNSVGDALNNNGHKSYGHLANTLSIGLLLSTPLIIEVKKDQWKLYLGTYSCLRYGLFDYTYGLTATGDPFYQGPTSNMDQIENIFPLWLVQSSKVIFICVGVAWTFDTPDKKYSFEIPKTLK